MSPSRQQEKSHLKTGLVQDVLFSNNGYWKAVFQF
jgi:hypothetical protein